MINHGYVPRKVEGETFNLNFQDIKLALDNLAKVINVVSVFSFVTVGNNGGGFVGLVPPKLSDGTTSLYRALAGMRLAAAVDLTTLASLQTSFEQVLTSNDQIRQIDSSNLSANKIVFLLTG